MPNALLSTIKWVCKNGWIEIVGGVKMEDMYCDQEQKMEFVSTSMMTKVAVFTKSSQINVQPSLGGMKTCLQTDLGLKLSNFVRA